MNDLYTSPSFVERRIDFTPRAGYLLTNASVATYNGRVAMLVHATDHWMDDRGIWRPLDAPESRCRFADNLIYLVWYSPDFELELVTEVTNDRLDPSPPWPFRGFEGSRLFAWKDDLWAGLATSGITGCSGDEFYMGRIEPSVRNLYTDFGQPHSHMFADLKRLAEYGKGKNWMPQLIDGKLWFHYWPGILIGPNGERAGSEPGDWVKTLHGGSQVIPFEDGGLAIAHDYDDVPDTFRRATRQYFMRFDAAGQPTTTAPIRLHPTAQLEIVTGMAMHPDGERLMISYGRDEADETTPRQERAFIATIDANEVGRML